MLANIVLHPFAMWLKFFGQATRSWLLRDGDWTNLLEIKTLKLTSWYPIFIFYLLRLDFCRELRIYHQEGRRLQRTFQVLSLSFLPSYPQQGENLGTRQWILILGKLGKQRRLLSDWLFAFFVFSLLSARKWVNKDGCQSHPILLRSFVQDGMERFTKCDVFLLAYSTYRGRWQDFFICVYCWVRCKKNSFKAKYIGQDGKFLIYKMLQ